MRAIFNLFNHSFTYILFKVCIFNVDIMAHLHHYVPSIHYSKENVICPCETVLAKFHLIVVGGDQLTVAE